MNAPPVPQRRPTGSFLVGAAQVGRYELLMQLASGGMATVYIGRQRGAGGFERIVAIKRMHPHIGAVPELAAAFMDEARIASVIHHPNVVNVHDVHDDEGERLLVMDYVEGVSLANLTRAARKRELKIPRPVALKIVVEALKGLHAAHEQRNMTGQPLNVVHRDATPQNILIGVDGAVKLTDFGIARAAERSTETAAGQVKGKFRYMAPEQAMGKQIDRRVDIFAIGAVLYEVLSGQQFLKGDSDAEVLRALALADFLPLHEADPTVPRDLSEVVMRALTQNPEARWPTAEAFSMAIESWARQHAKTATSHEVARVVNELCGQQIEERKQQLLEVLAGQRPPVSLNSSMLGGPAGQGEGGQSGSGSYSGPVSTEAQITGLPVSPTQILAEAPPAPSHRKLLLGAIGAATVAVLVAAGVVATSMNRRAEPSAIAAAPSASAPAKAEPRATISVSSDKRITAVRAAQIGDIAFNDAGVSFSLPHGSTPVEVHIKLADGTERQETVTPDGDGAIRIGSPEPVASAQPAPTDKEKKKAPASDKKAEPPSTTAAAATAAGAAGKAGDKPPAKPPAQLRKNPYE